MITDPIDTFRRDEAILGDNIGVTRDRLASVLRVRLAEFVVPMKQISDEDLIKVYESSPTAFGFMCRVARGFY